MAKKLLDQLSGTLRAKHREASPCGITPTAPKKPISIGRLYVIFELTVPSTSDARHTPRDNSRE